MGIIKKINMICSLSCRPIYIIVLLLILLYLFNCYTTFDYIVDDSFTALHYARNFVDYGSLSGNQGERHHGIHDYVYVLIMSLIYRIWHLPEMLPILMKIFLIICGVVTLALPVLFYSTLKLSLFAKTWYLSALATATPYVVWSVAGYGGVLLGLEVMVMFILFPQVMTSLWKLRFFLLLSVITIYTRLDMAVLVLPLICFVLFSGMRRNGRQVFFWWLIPAITIQCIIWTYYCILPSFVSKITVQCPIEYYNNSLLPRVLQGPRWTFLPESVSNILTQVYYSNFLPRVINKLAGTGKSIFGALHFCEFLILNINIIHIMLIVFFVFVWRKAAPPIRAFLTAMAIYFMYIFFQGEIHMMHVYRQYVPFLPVIYLTSAYAIQEFIILKKAWHGLRIKVLAVFIISMLTINEFINLYYIQNKSMHLSFITRLDPGELTIKDGYLSINAWKDVAYYIRDNFDRQETVLVGPYVSLTPYITNFYTFDNYALADKKSSIRLLQNGKKCKHANKIALSVANIRTASLDDTDIKNAIKEGLNVSLDDIVYYSVGKDKKGSPQIYSREKYRSKECFVVWCVFVDRQYEGKFCMRPI